MAIIMTSFELYAQSVLTFQDVADTLKVGKSVSSMGVSFVDYDGDGFDDIFVTTNAPDSNFLFKNQFPEEFSNETVNTNLVLTKASRSGVFGDYTGDKLLDLFITNHGYSTPSIAFH